MAVDKTPLWTPAVAGGEKVRFRISQILLFGQEEELGKNPDSLDVLPKFQNGGLPEVVRALAESPRWTPGSQNGEPVRVKYTVPVDFRIPAERKTASGPAQERNTTRR